MIANSFDLDVDELPEIVSTETVEGWTYASQIVLLHNLEHRFRVSFSLEQMISMTSAAKIVEVLRQIRGQAP